MENKLLIIPTLVAPLCVGCAGVQKQSQEQSRPNIILCVADDHGMDALGCYGNPVIKTPTLDSLAGNGVRFTNAFCTSASSAASRSVLLTGLYGHATGSYGHVHDYHHFSTYEQVRSLPVILAESGYFTGRIGKYHVAPESVYHFDEVYDADPRNTVAMADACKGIFDSDEPFFLYFCTDDPHRGDPFIPEHWSDPNRFGNLDEGYEGVETIKYSPDEVLVPSFLPDTKRTREELAEYYESISRIDQGMKRLLDNLKKSGKAENTIVIYISDNGMAFPGAKTTVYEPGIKLPCIIYNPMQEAKGTTCDAMITWADMTPTILDMAEVDSSDEKFHGRSFYDVIGEEHPEGWDETLAAHNFHEITMYYPMRVLHERRFKLIWNVDWQQSYPFASDLWYSSTWQSVKRGGSMQYGKRSIDAFLQRSRFELYDLQNDPDEVVNLADNKEYEQTLERMKARLKTRLVETSDPWLICWGDYDLSLQGTGVNL